MGRDEVVSGEHANVQPHRSMQKPQCGMSYFSVASQLAGKVPMYISGDSTQKWEISFKQLVFKIKGVMHGHTKATLWMGIVQPLWRTMVDLVLYLGLHASGLELINKLDLKYSTIGSFDIMMQNF